MTVDLDLAPGAEPRLRAALDAAATTSPVPPAWDAIRHRVELGDVVVIPPRRRSPLLLASVVLVLVALAGLAVAATRGGDRGVTATDPPDFYCTVLAQPARTGLTLLVYLDLDVPPDQVETVRATIRASAGTEGFGYLSRGAAYELALQLFADEETMVDLLRPEDVPTLFTVLVADQDAATDLRVILDSMDGILETTLGDVLPEPPDVFTVLASVARDDWVDGPTDLGLYPVAPEVVDAFRASAPDDLSTEVPAAAQALVDPLGATAAAARAADVVVTDAVERCGRELPPR